MDSREVALSTFSVNEKVGQKVSRSIEREEHQKTTTERIAFAEKWRIVKKEAKSEIKERLDQNPCESPTKELLSDHSQDREDVTKNERHT